MEQLNIIMLVVSGLVLFSLYSGIRNSQRLKKLEANSKNETMQVFIDRLFKENKNFKNFDNIEFKELITIEVQNKFFASRTFRKHYFEYEVLLMKYVNEALELALKKRRNLNKIKTLKKVS